MAWVGFSLGTVLAARSFIAHEIGDLLIGVVGHADIARSAKAYAGTVVPTLASTAAGNLAEVVLSKGWGWPTGWMPFLSSVQQIIQNRDGIADVLSPLTRAGTCGSRRACFIVGDTDHLATPDDARNCAARFPCGDVKVVPGLGHGTHRDGAIAWENAVSSQVVVEIAAWCGPAREAKSPAAPQQ